MDTYKKIESYTTEKSAQGFEGYQDCLEYYKKFTLEQLNYIGTMAKLAVESNKKFYEFKQIVPMFISMITLFLGIIPEQLKNNIDTFEKMTLVLIIGIVFYYSMYYLIDRSSCGMIIRNGRVLLFVEQTKKEKEFEEDIYTGSYENEEKIYTVKIAKR